MGLGPCGQRLWVEHARRSASTSAAGPASAGGTLSILSWHRDRALGPPARLRRRQHRGRQPPVHADADHLRPGREGRRSVRARCRRSHRHRHHLRGAKEWKFTIKDGVKWEDGKAVTCEDFKYGISRTFAVDVITGGPNYAIQYLDIPKNKDGSSAYAGPYKKTGQDAVRQGSHLRRATRSPSRWPSRPATSTRPRPCPPSAPSAPTRTRATKSNYAIFSNGPYMLEGTWTANKGGTFVRNAELGPEARTRSARPTRTRSLPGRVADAGDPRTSASSPTPATTRTPSPSTRLPPALLRNPSNRRRSARSRSSPVAVHRLPGPELQVQGHGNDKAREALAMATDRTPTSPHRVVDQVVKADQLADQPGAAATTVPEHHRCCRATG